MSFSQLVCKSTISQKNKLFNVIFPASLQIDIFKKKQIIQCHFPSWFANGHFQKKTNYSMSFSQLVCKSTISQKKQIIQCHFPSWFANRHFQKTQIIQCRFPSWFVNRQSQKKQKKERQL